MGKLTVLWLALLAPFLPADAECRPTAPASAERGALPAPLRRAKSAPASPHGALPARAGAHPPVSITPPSLTGQALRDELQTSWKHAEEERTALQAERAGLEKLRAEIAKARESLREETTRLEDLLKRSSSRDSPPSAPPPAGPRTAAPAPNAGSLKKPAEPVGKLTRMVGSMKPEQAAALLARLDRRLAVQILRRMSPRQAGAALGRLPVEVSADLASRVARQDIGGRP